MEILGGERAAWSVSARKVTIKNGSGKIDEICMISNKAVVGDKNANNAGEDFILRIKDRRSHNCVLRI